MNAANWTEFLEKMVSVLLGGVGTWLAVRSFYEKRHQETLDRYATCKQKEYAAERDFEHLRRNQEQMKEALRVLDDELTETRADFKELKGMLVVVFSQSGESISGIFAHRREKQE
jgi:ABC-type nickel/cobalt efflux system permease component RcnA